MPIKKSPDYYLNIMKDIAENNGGKLLSTEWGGAHKNYEFEHKNGFKFFKKYSTLQQHGWIKTGVIYLAKAEEIAKSRGGVLLSTEFKNSKQLLDFQDDSGIKFKCSLKNLKTGQWTPDRGLVSEPICRQTLEYIFGFSFPKSTKVLHKGITNRKRYLELDGYCKELNIAFEYQGHPSHWNNKHDNYNSVNQRDKEKKILCDQLNVILITIPKFKENSKKWDSNNALNLILDLIYIIFREKKKSLPNINTQGFKIDFSQISRNKNNIQNLEKIALENNGSLLSSEWKGSKFSYKFKTNKGIIFEMSLQNYQLNGWPKNIKKYNNLKNGHKKDSTILLKELDFIAQQHGGKLLSKKWIGNQKKYLFETKKEVTFEKTAQELKKLGWPKRYRK
jgi:predicted metalloenzyme YecM